MAYKVTFPDKGYNTSSTQKFYSVGDVEITPSGDLIIYNKDMKIFAAFAKGCWERVDEY
jgi:hypothetical protein